MSILYVSHPDGSAYYASKSDMALSVQFVETMKAKLRFVEDLRIRKMFGGAGLYAGDVMFGMLADDQIWLKADATTQVKFEQRGMRPFRSDAKGKGMPYWEIPPAILDDDDALAAWVGEARAVAMRSKKK